MPDVLLINVNFYGVPELQEPVGIEQLAGIMRAAGHTVELCDPTIDGDSLDVTVERILRGPPARVVGIGAFTDQAVTLRWVGEVASRLRTAGWEGHIIAGGYGATVRFRDYLAEIPALDAVVLGGGELTFPELTARVTAGRDLEGVLGLARRAGADVAWTRPRRVTDLDRLPPPARDLLKARRAKYGPRTMAYILAGNGCPFQCTYCSIKSYLAFHDGPVYCKKSARVIADEMEGIVTGLDVTNFTLLDDNFVVLDAEGIARLRGLRDEIRRRGLKVKLLVMTRPDSITAEVLDILKEMGTESIFIGVEAVHADDLAVYNRKGSRRVDSALELLQEKGFGLDLYSARRCRIGFIGFNPMSSLDTLEANVRFFARHRVPPKTLFQRVRIHRNTELRDIVAREGLLRHDPEQHMDYSEDVYRFKHPEVGVIYDLCQRLLREHYGMRNRVRRVEKCIALGGDDYPDISLAGCARAIDERVVGFLGELVAAARASAAAAAGAAADVPAALEACYRRAAADIAAYYDRERLEAKVSALERRLKADGRYMEADFHL